MRTRRLMAALSCSIVASALLPTTAMAWNDAGHRISATIAYRRLSDADRRTIDALLEQHPHYATMLVDDLPEGVAKGEWAFAKAASWPDAVRPPGRGFPTYKPPSVTQYHRSVWHYKDMPYAPDGDFKMPAAPTSTTTNDNAEPGDAIEALKHNVKRLGDASASPAERAVALAWVEHLTGDIHQPLHGCTLYSATYPKGDKGGNDQSVLTESGVQNLHTIWDNALGNASTFPAVDAIVRDLALDPRVDVTKTKVYADHKSADAWIEESHELAIAFVYLDGKLRTAKTSDARADENGKTSAEVPTLPLMYLTNANLIARQRIALAGARLADSIHAALNDGR